MQTIGERLEEARKRKGISIREAAEATKIRGDYLQKFENNQFDINLSDLYVRGFLRSYCAYLKLPAERILSDFRSLGIAGDGKLKTPSREVYGRMDLSHASASGGHKASKDNLDPEPVSGLDEDAGPNKRTFARIGTSLPTGTFIDQRVLIKIGAGIGIALLLVLLIWGARSLFSSRPLTPAASDRIARLAPDERSITFTALDTVQLRVSLKRNEQDALGEEIFNGTLVRGESRVLPRKGDLYISANLIENIEVDADGRKMRPSQHNFRGNQRILLPGGNR